MENITTLKEPKRIGNKAEVLTTEDQKGFFEKIKTYLVPTTDKFSAKIKDIKNYLDTYKLKGHDEADKQEYIEKILKEIRNTSNQGISIIKGFIKTLEVQSGENTNKKEEILVYENLLKQRNKINRIMKREYKKRALRFQKKEEILKTLLNENPFSDTPIMYTSKTKNKTYQAYITNKPMKNGNKDKYDIEIDDTIEDKNGKQRHIKVKFTTDIDPKEINKRIQSADTNQQDIENIIKEIEQFIYLQNNLFGKIN